MAIVSYNISNLINGISNQADILRRDSQAELQDNGWSSVVEGLQKRPPIENVSKLSTTTDFSDGYVHAINRDTDERYIATFTDGDIEVFGIDGTAYYVDNVADIGYLPANCNENLRAVTFDDFTFVTNTNKLVEKTSASTSVSNPSALLEVRSAGYELEYQIEIHVDHGCGSSSSSTSGGWITVAQLETGNGAPYNETNVIAQELFDGSVHGGGGGSSSFNLTDDLENQTGITWSMEIVSNTIYIESTSGCDFDVRVTDGAGGNNLLVTKDSVQVFNDLPVHGKPGFKVAVDPAPESNSDTYWVEFVDGEGETEITTGSWEETTAPGLRNEIDAATMPHVLVRRFDDGSGTITGTPNAKYFSFEEFDWADRTVGDADTNADPTFIGTKIRDAFFFRDRFGLLTPTSVVMSAQGEYGNFYRNTVTTLLDSDKIDLEISDNQVSNLFWAVPDEQDLIIFSDQTQYILKAEGLLTPSTATITATTRYESSRTVRPLLIGDAVFFAQQNGGYVGIREYRININTQKRVADENTEHVEKYIKGDVRDMTGSAAQRCFVVATENSQYVFVYQWFTNNNQKVQSAWHRWDLSTNGIMLGMRFIDTTIYFVVQRSDGVYLEKLETEPGKIDTEESNIRYLLDRRVGIGDVVRWYDAGTDTTTIQLPYTIDNCDDITVVADSQPNYDSPDETYYLIQDCDTGEINSNVQVKASEWDIGDVFSTGGRCYSVICPSSVSSSSSSSSS